jgi:murein DD-endopeptidase MepM/ murein hydrolase activator NlpD
MKQNFYLFFLLLFVFISSSITTNGQPYFPLIKPLYPLTIPMSISGGFGDLRSNSLHFGIDFRTETKTGYPVLASDSGYVTRIKIEPGGYGKAIYIDHRNGWISVYAHLEKLSPILEKYCKTEQYKLMQFGVDLFPGKDSLIVNRGDTIGLSGNSGASSGPHLHFEIRDKKTQTPVNIPIYFDFPINDALPPIIDKLWVYPLQDSSQVNCLPYNSYYNIINKNGSTLLENNNTLYGWKKIGFGIEVYDPFDKNNNKTGIYSIDLWDNDSLIFNQTIDKISFAETRYVNSIIDYQYYITSFNRINKLFIDPNNKLTNYYKNINNGIISITDTSLHIIKIRVKDANLNTNELIFKIKGEQNELLKPFKDSTTIGDKKIILCKYDQVYNNNNIKVLFATNSLYNDILFKYNKLPQLPGLYSNIHQLHNKYTPIHQPITIRITPTNLPDSLKEKAIIAYIDKNKPVWGSGSYKSGYIETTTRLFGDYAITLDTIAPKIIPTFKIRKLLNFENEKQIAFKISDILSGIGTYAGSIDGNWALFEYDAKNDLLFYTFDPEKIIYGTNHKLFLLVTDLKGNQSEYRAEFFK